MYALLTLKLRRRPWEFRAIASQVTRVEPMHQQQEQRRSDVVRGLRFTSMPLRVPEGGWRVGVMGNMEMPRLRLGFRVSGLGLRAKSLYTGKEEWRCKKKVENDMSHCLNS